MSHFFNFSKLDINHVRLNKHKIFDINSHQKQYSRDYHLTVASLEYVYNIDQVPNSRRQAMLRDDWPEWKAKIDEEVTILMENNVGELVDKASLPKGTKILFWKVCFLLEIFTRWEPCVQRKVCRPWLSPELWRGLP